MIGKKLGFTDLCSLFDRSQLLGYKTGAQDVATYERLSENASLAEG